MINTLIFEKAGLLNNYYTPVLKLDYEKRQKKVPHPNEIQNKTYLDYEWKVSLHPSPNNFYLRTFVFYEGTKVRRYLR